MHEVYGEFAALPASTIFHGASRYYVRCKREAVRSLAWASLLVWCPLLPEDETFSPPKACHTCTSVGRCGLSILRCKS
jgi:hypothetical protein